MKTRRNSWIINSQTITNWDIDEYSFEIGPIKLRPSSGARLQCAHHCSGLSYFALQNGTSCFCGNDGWSANSAEAPAGECNVPCTGDPSTICGGPWRNSVYRITENVADECTLLGVRDSPFPLRVVPATASLGSDLQFKSMNLYLK